MIAWLKFIHVATIAIWAAGLISLPGLYVQRAHVSDDDQLYMLQRIVRSAYVRLISPAAFIAVASGIALIFLRETFVAWFSLKLLFVGILVVIHALTGLVIIRLFREGEVYPVWRFFAVTGLTLVVVVIILALVLAKPHIAIGYPAALGQPGALRDLLADFIPWTIP